MSDSVNKDTYLLIKVISSHISRVIYTALMDYLTKQLHLDISKLVGFGSDGASAMTGKTKGVAARLRNLLLFLIVIHCMAHRYIDQFQKALTDIYYHFYLSTGRILQVKEIQKILELPDVAMKKVFEI